MPDAQFTVPYPEHPHFVGREEDLARLHAALQGEGPVGINPAAMGNPTGVTGQGGIGKTQLAVAYAYRYREDYPDGVYWLNAAESLWSEFANLGRHFLGQGGEGALKTRLYETLRTRFKVEEIRDLCFELGINYEEFSPQLGISSLARELVAYCQRHGKLDLLETAVRRLRGDLAQPQAQDELVMHAFTWLRGHPRSLVILDNVADPAALDESLTSDCVPARLPGRVLFTARRRDLGHFYSVPLDTLPRDEAMKLILRGRRVTGLHPTDFTWADAICAMLGDLPLALEIAAAHLQDLSDVSLYDYYAELRWRGALDVISDSRIEVKTRHDTGLMAVLTSQWERLWPEAQLFLQVAGQLWEAADVPVARLGLLAGIPDKGDSVFDVTYKRVADRLGNLSLIERLEGDRIRLHPLVHVFARKQVPSGFEGDFREACIRRLLNACSDVRMLERQCDLRGIDELMQDLLAAERLFDRAMFAHEIRVELTQSLRTYLRVLRREAHNLRGWRREDAPGFLTQQLHLRLFDSSTPALFGDLAACLRLRGPAWQLRWAARVVSPALEMTLVGHEEGVQAVAVTPDGRRVVSGGSEGKLHVWNLDTGALERSMAGHEEGVQAVAVTPDGQRVVSGGDEGMLRVWNLDTGALERTLAGHEDWVLAVVVTPDGRRVVSGGSEGKLHVWNLNTGALERTLAGHKDWVLAVAVTPDSRRVISGGSEGKLHVWNLNTGALERTLVAQGMVWSVKVTPDGRRAVSGGDDRTLLVWNLDTGALEQTLVGHEEWVLAVAVTPDGRRVVSGGDDRTLRVWNLDTGALERSLAGHERGVRAVAVTPDGRRGISGGGDGGLRVWNLDTGDVERTAVGHKGRVNAVVTASVTTLDSRWAVSGGSDGKLHVWNLDTGALERTICGHEEGVDVVAVTPDSRRAVSGGSDGSYVWNLDSGEEHRTLDGYESWVRAVAVTPDGRRAVTGGNYRALRVWNLDTGALEGTLVGHEDTVLVVAVTPDGQRAVSGGVVGTLIVWSLETGQSDWEMAANQGMVRALAVTPDGRRVVSGGDDRTLRLWELDTGCELAHIAFDAAITCVAVAPGNPPLVVAGDAAGSVYCLEWIE